MFNHVKRIFIVLIAVLSVCCVVGCTEVTADAINGRTPTPAVDITKQEQPKPSNASGLDDPEGGVERYFIARFVTNEGLAVASKEVTILETEPTTYRTNYIFAGWYLTENFSDSRVIFPYRLTQDTTFYAKWLTAGTVTISTADELMRISRGLEGNYALANNIDLQGRVWTPLGDRQNPFSGTFDGNGYTVYNMYVEPEAQDEEFNYISVGLFGHVTGRIANVTVSSFIIQLDGAFSRFYVGGVAGWMETGSLTNCHASGRIVNPELDYEGTIWDDLFGSYAQPTKLTQFGLVTGRVGSASVTRCSAEGSIVSKSVEDSVYAGGIAGYNEAGTFNGCYASVSVEARFAGGLLGYNNGGVISCFAVGNVTGSRAYPAIAGGLVAYNDMAGTIRRCYATGAASARTAGGLVGINMFSYIDPVGGRVENCYATGDVTAAEYGGGLIGRAEAELPVKGSTNYSGLIDDQFYFIQYCFAYGNVTVDVKDVYYVEDNGSTTGTNGVYHSVFAGGLIGHATEPLIRSAVAFGDVLARSTRPINGTDQLVYNPVYADNVVGQSTALISTRNNIYGFSGQEVRRNDTVYSGFNSAAKVEYASLNTYSFLRTQMGFDNQIWNLNNLDFEAGRVPTLL